MALTTKSQTYATTKLVLAHRAESNWEVTALDKADGPIPVVWSEKPGEYKSVCGKKINSARPVIIFCGYSSWAVLYAWMNNRVAKMWLRDKPPSAAVAKSYGRERGRKRPGNDQVR